jgi:hypothetical protein
MALTNLEILINQVDNQTPEENAKELKEYRKLYGALNPMYNTCGKCQYEDEYGCWQPYCKRKCKSKTEADNCDDMKFEVGLPWVSIEESMRIK